MIHKPNPHGFSLLGVLVAILVVVLLIAGGVYVWQRNKDDNNKQSNNTNAQTDKSKEDKQNEVEELDATANWVPVATQDGAFEMKVPDGWKLTRHPGNFLGAMDVTHLPGTRAVIEDSNTEYTGHSLRFRASITPLDDAGLGPQWASPQPGLEESTEDFSIGSLHGKRYKGVFTQDGRQTLYEYVFDLGSDKKLDIVYVVEQGKNDKDDVVTVEKAISTIELK
ncbi:hypothetical protein [Phytohabitans suffuscus]|uniref:Uncharacterized protein n=1 Tax=Phytohabitans suffuscus TaxID=624315 RepID=A0A6F8YEB2_9ACTN|nr:hypothetical protein [Phytohabitans suffuscus]BCB84442.1 hypothetical protein Psuf_017550 [Phytohabitans suffuscus]